jgi:transposase InsO family protein
MTENDREKIALFRYGLISPILNGQVKNQKEYLQKQAAKIHNVPYYGSKEYVPKTIYGWLRAYRRGGFDALKPKHRSDRGRSRKITGQLKNRLLKLRENNPGISVKLFYDQMVKKKEFRPSELSYSTVYRFFKKNDLIKTDVKKQPDRRRFSFDIVNKMWQGDLSYGPWLNINGKKKRSYLLAFIDDYSRIVPYGMFSLTEKFSGLKKVFSQALLRRGIPDLVYVDNGKIYKSDRLHLACAELGITLIHTKPYDAASKGKIERFFSTVKKRFVPLLTKEDKSSLNNLNKAFWQWLETDYHRKKHSALEQTPLKTYMNQISKVKTLDNPKILEKIFLKRDTRKVKHDGTISFKKKLYQVPPSLIGKKIEIRFNPETKKELYIYEQGQEITKAEPVNLQENAYLKRKRHLDYQNLIPEGGRN